MSEPTTYWEERCALAETAVQRLANIVLNGNPMLYTALQSWADEWSRLREEVHLEYEAKQKAPTP